MPTSLQKKISNKNVANANGFILIRNKKIEVRKGANRIFHKKNIDLIIYNILDLLKNQPKGAI